MSKVGNKEGNENFYASAKWGKTAGKSTWKSEMTEVNYRTDKRQTQKKRTLTEFYYKFIHFRTPHTLMLFLNDING